MDYIRWLIKTWFAEDPSILIPLFLLACLVTGIGLWLNLVLGLVLVIASLIFFGTIAYVFASDAYHESYKKFRQERTKPQ